MKKFLQHSGIALPLLTNNIDTDQIIPSREMKKVSKIGLGEGLFSGQRYLYEGLEKKGLNPDFLLNQHPYHKSTILISAKNFGCGSSREHAVWALAEYGFKAIIAESFGNIFRENCLRNGLLPIVLNKDEINELVQTVRVAPNVNQLTIDLERCQVGTSDGKKFGFELEDYYQKMLLNGWDFIDLALQHTDQIDSFVDEDKTARSWAYL